MAKITLIDLLTKREYLVPLKETAFVGRSRINDVCVPQSNASMDVSRVHCVICQDSENLGIPLYIMDYDSAYGTYVNETKLQKEECMNLFDGDKITLGNYELRVKIEVAEK